MPPFHGSAIGRRCSLSKLWALLVNMSASTWIEKARSAMLTSMTVSRCCTIGESEDHSSKSACKGSTLALKLRAADITRSPNRGISGPTKRTYVLQIFFFKTLKKRPFLKVAWRTSLQRISLPPLHVELSGTSEMFIFKVCLENLPPSNIPLLLWQHR